MADVLSGFHREGPGAARQAPGQAQRTSDDPHRAPGIYLHVPFCNRVCPYCDFAVRTGGRDERRAFIDGLLREIDWWAAHAPPPRGRLPQASSTVYLGGGTPSALTAEQIAVLLDRLRRRLPVARAAELTLEVNPEDVSADSLDAWRRLGFTRLSLGVQSFDDDALAVLGRAHRARQAVAAVEASLAAGFDAISVDLIFAVPGQSPETWRASLQQAVDLQPQHISCYELTVHRGTRFYESRARGRLVEETDDRKAALFFSTHRFLQAAGYPAYEVSNFARDDAHRSRHNSKYWSHTAYLGLGPSAHSFDGDARRWWNIRELEAWMVGLGGKGPVAGEEELEGSELALEALALGLRTSDGVDLGAIDARHRVALSDRNGALIERLAADGLLEEPREGARLRPTLEGMAVADRLATAFEIGDTEVEHAPGAGGAPGMTLPTIAIR